MAATAKAELNEREGGTDLADVFLQYLNDATNAPTNRRRRLEGYDLKGECKSADECKLSGEALDIFYVYAIDLLEDVFWAAHGDDNAARRVTKVVECVFAPLMAEAFKKSLDILASEPVTTAPKNRVQSAA
jgi:hypothetical protein